MRLVQRDGARAGLRFVARWDGYVGIPDPAVVGMRLRFETDRHDSGWIDLAGSGWVRRLRFEDVHGTAGGVRRVVIRQGVGSGHFVLHATGPDRPIPLDDASRIAVTIASGDLRWCAEASGQSVRTVRRRVVARSASPLAHCPCPPVPADTFATIEQRIFGRHTCTAALCHGRAPGQGGLLLAGGAAYENLVGVPSLADGTMPRVTPGDPDRSLLWRKLAARTLQLRGVPGNAMPIGDPSLDAIELDAVRRWIAAGAPEHGAVPDADTLLGCATTFSTPRSHPGR